MVILVIQVNLVIFANMAKLVNMHKSKLELHNEAHIVPFMDLYICSHICM